MDYERFHTLHRLLRQGIGGPRQEVLLAEFRRRGYWWVHEPCRPTLGLPLSNPKTSLLKSEVSISVAWLFGFSAQAGKAVEA